LPPGQAPELLALAPLLALASAREMTATGSSCSQR